MSKNYILALKRKRDELAARLDKLDETIFEVATSGFASATLSAGGGSKSYTRADLSQLRALRTDWANQISRLDTQLSGRSRVRHLVITRSF